MSRDVDVLNLHPWFVNGNSLAQIAGDKESLVFIDWFKEESCYVGINIGVEQTASLLC